MDCRRQRPSIHEISLELLTPEKERVISSEGGFLQSCPGYNTARLPQGES